MPWLSPSIKLIETFLESKRNEPLPPTRPRPCASPSLSLSFALRRSLFFPTPATRPSPPTARAARARRPCFARSPSLFPPVTLSAVSPDQPSLSPLLSLPPFTRSIVDSPSNRTRACLPPPSPSRRRNRGSSFPFCPRGGCRLPASFFPSSSHPRNPPPRGPMPMLPSHSARRVLLLRIRIAACFPDRKFSEENFSAGRAHGFRPGRAQRGDYFSRCRVKGFPTLRAVAGRLLGLLAFKMCRAQDKHSGRRVSVSLCPARWNCFEERRVEMLYNGPPVM